MQAIREYSFALVKWSATAVAAIVGFAVGMIAVGWIAFEFLVFLVQG